MGLPYTDPNVEIPEDEWGIDITRPGLLEWKNLINKTSRKYKKCERRHKFLELVLKNLEFLNFLLAFWYQATHSCCVFVD